ncbi:MAG: hypothetical protein SNG27_06405 [Rikenellaceae bacterium]
MKYKEKQYLCGRTKQIIISIDWGLSRGDIGSLNYVVDSVDFFYRKSIESSIYDDLSLKGELSDFKVDDVEFMKSRLWLKKTLLQSLQLRIEKDITDHKELINNIVTILSLTLAILSIAIGIISILL